MSQQLVASTLNPDPADELSARLKDPLWCLARQWQTGEFQAENGGAPAYVHVTKADHPLTSVNRDPQLRAAQSVRLNLADPLDMAVEAETGAGDAPGWRAEALDYRFGLSTGAHDLLAEDYDGRALDWWHFDLVGARAAQTPETVERMVPTMLHFKGAPHPRWWRFEDGDADFETAVDPEPNVLSTILPEFFFTDLDNWFVLPLPLAAGSLRELRSVRVVDSFGVVTTLGPAQRELDGTAEWRLFCLSGLEQQRQGQDGAYLFSPHVAGEVLDNDTLEDVRFVRDEQANLVWAVEMLYIDGAGLPVRNGDGPRIAAQPALQAALPAGTDGSFRLQSDTPDYWIPYVPRFLAPGQAVDGAIYLRRARTVEAATLADPQFKSRIVRETLRLNEEEVGSVGIRVRRIHRYSRGTDGVPRHWVARCREVTDRLGSGPGLRFDIVLGRQG